MTGASAGVRFLPVGRDGLLLEVAGVDQARELYAAVLALAGIGEGADDASGADALPRPADVVPGARTVLLVGIDPGRWRERLVGWGPTGAPTTGGRLHTLRVVYDGADLADVAAQWDCTPEEVVDRHRAAVFTVAFCGFAPGFAYCTSEPALPAVARRHDPRTRVPAGSVALAGEYCGIYPGEMPGGWQLIGRSEAVLFDPDRERPGLLAPGDRVRFEAAG